MKLLVVDYKGHSRRYFFSTDVPLTTEEIPVTWENKWEIEVIREMKQLGLERGYYRTLNRNLGLIKLVALTLLVLLLVRYVLNLSLGVKRLTNVLQRFHLNLG